MNKKQFKNYFNNNEVDNEVGNKEWLNEYERQMKLLGGGVT